MFETLVPGFLRSPLKIGIDFSDREYRLGETIDVAIELEPRRDVEVTEGRVDLVCEERYVETFTRTVPVRSSAGLISKKGVATRRTYSKQEVKEYRNTYVHSSKMFVKTARFSKSATGTYRARLEIKPEKPKHSGTGTATWTLVTTLDIPDDREVTEERKVIVTID